MLKQHQVFTLRPSGVWHHVVVVHILLSASHLYETLEQIHPTARSHISNATG